MNEYPLQGSKGQNARASSLEDYSRIRPTKKIVDPWSFISFFKRILIWLKNWLIKQWNFQTWLPKFHLKPLIHNFFVFLSTRNKDFFRTQTQKHDWKASWKNCLGPVPIPFLFFSLNMLSKPYSSTMATSLYIYS